MNELSITRSALNERLVLNDMAPETWYEQVQNTTAAHLCASWDELVLICVNLFSQGKFSHSLREVLVPIQVNKEIINDAYILEL